MQKLILMLNYRNASIEDSKLYFNWANEIEVRRQSYQNELFKFEVHQDWFLCKLKDDNCLMLVFENQFKEPVGQVRIEKKDSKNALIGISVDKNFRGQGLASRIIELACNYYLNIYKNIVIMAYVKIDNLASIHSFENAGFVFLEDIVYCNALSKVYIKNNNYEYR